MTGPVPGPRPPVAGDDEPGRTGGADRARSVEILLVVGLVVAGFVAAGLWRLLVHATAGLGDEQEVQAGVDGTLALLQVVAGVLTAAVVLARPGPRPARRALVAVVGSAVAGAVSWQLGDLLGTPHLAAVGAAFVWPVATAVALFLGAVLPGTSARLNDSMPLHAQENADAVVSPDERSGPSEPR